MRACLLALAALALARPPPAAPAASPAPRLDPLAARHIKAQILAKLGLTSRPTPLGAPPRDVVRRILARAADPRPPPPEAMREIIAIAHREWQRQVAGENKFRGPISKFLKIESKVHPCDERNMITQMKIILLATWGL